MKEMYQQKLHFSINFQANLSNLDNNVEINHALTFNPQAKIQQVSHMNFQPKDMVFSLEN